MFDLYEYLVYYESFFQFIPLLRLVFIDHSLTLHGIDTLKQRELKKKKQLKKKSTLST